MERKRWRETDGKRRTNVGGFPDEKQDHWGVPAQVDIMNYALISMVNGRWLIFFGRDWSWGSAVMRLKEIHGFLRLPSSIGEQLYWMKDALLVPFF